MAIKMIKQYSLEDISGSIRQMRGEMGWSQNELAKVTNMSASIISRYERGERMPTFDKYMRIIEATGHQIQII